MTNQHAGSWMRRAIRGPFASRSWRTRCVGVLVTAVLTLLTQVGGILTWPAWGIVVGAPSHRGVRGVAWGLALYAVGSLTLIPAAASLAGRTTLPLVERGGLAPRSPLFWMLNRHYVRHEVRAEIDHLARAVGHPGMPLRYLDASFPFRSPMWMLPHASHADGLAVDLALPLCDPTTGEPVDEGGSPIGYWGYVAMAPGERHAVEARSWDLRWDFDALQPWIGNTRLDEHRLARLVAAADERDAVRKMLLEPRLKERLSDELSTSERTLLRYQGDPWARHDDHVHVHFTPRGRD